MYTGDARVPPMVPLMYTFKCTKLQHVFWILLIKASFQRMIYFTSSQCPQAECERAQSEIILWESKMQLGDRYRLRQMALLPCLVNFVQGERLTSLCKIGSAECIYILKLAKLVQESSCS